LLLHLKEFFPVSQRSQLPDVYLFTKGGPSFILQQFGDRQIDENRTMLKIERIYFNFQIGIGRFVD